MRLNEAVRQFYFYLSSNGHSRRTAKIYRSVLEDFAGRHPEIESDAVSAVMLQDYMAALGHLSGSTKNLRKSALRSFFNWLVDAGYLIRNPSRLLKSEKTVQAEARRLEADEVARFREAIRDSARDNLLFSAYLMTGCRLRELLALNVGEVRGKDVITIIGKGKKARQIFLNPFLTGLVEKVIAGRADGEPLFMSAQAHRLSASRVQALLRHYCEQAGIERISPHNLRHTFLTMLYGASNNILLCQQAAGHSSVQTTQRYCHVSQSQLQSAVVGLYQ